MSLDQATTAQRTRILADALAHVGYGADHIRNDWKYSNFDLMKKWIDDDDPDKYPENEAPSTLDMAAFYDEKEHDWNTISLAAKLSRIDLVKDKDRGQQEARKIFSETASPCVLFAGNGTADLWLRCWGQPSPVKDIAFEAPQLRKAFEHNRRELEREALATLRGGQRYLFDGLNSARCEELATFLNRGITKATWFSQKIKCPLDADSGKALSRIAIGLLAARILEDKEIIGDPDHQLHEARGLLREADKLADGFFRHLISDDLTKLDQTIGKNIVEEMLLRIMAHLTGPVSFSMVTPEMLGHLYENALRAQRRQGKDVDLNGIHYTPLSLTRNVMSRIPLEDLPPAKRYALDIACGSGTFLLAASERLRAIFDANEVDAEPSVGDHLREHVIGNDLDSVALHVANLTYLLEHVIETGNADAVPSPKLWTRDALDLSVEDFGDNRPSIIIGNPPFGRANDGHQLANKFLLKALELLAPGGFLGMVMPGAFLKMRERGGVIATRRELLKTCELIEVWEMPLGVVGLSARQETCVIIARKIDNSVDHGTRQGATLFNVTYSSNQDAVRAQREDLRSSWAFIATGLPGRVHTPWIEDATARIIASPLDHVWRRIDFRHPVSDLCNHTVGITTNLKRTTFSGQQSPDFVPHLRSQGRLHPYFLRRHDWQNDPDHDHDYVNPSTADRSRLSKQFIMQGPKLIVTCDTNRNASIQVKAAYDDTGVFAEHHFYCFAFHAEIGKRDRWVQQLLLEVEERPLLLWLCAVMNSPISRAWVATCSTTRSSAIDVFMGLPLPLTYDPLIPEMVEQTDLFPRGSEDFKNLVDKINSQVLRSYGVTGEDATDVQCFLQSLTDPWAESSSNAHLPKQGSYRRIAGTVVSINIHNQSVALDLPRFTRQMRAPVVLPLPRELPGWALRDGVEFTCEVPTDCKNVDDLLSDPWMLRDFRSLPYSYLNEGQLEELIDYEHSESGN